MIVITSEIQKDYERFFKKFKPALEVVIQNSTNKAIQVMRTEVKKQVPKKWSIKKEEMKDFKIRKATSSNLEATATLRASRISLKDLSPAPNSPMTGRTTGGVTVMLREQRQNFRHAFVANFKGHLGVFERVKKNGKQQHYGAVKTVSFEAGGKSVSFERSGQVIRKISTIPSSLMVLSEKTDVPEAVQRRVQEAYDKAFTEEAEAMLKTLGVRL